MRYLENESDFKEIIKQDLVLVDFYATWCGPCQMMAGELDNLAKEDKSLEIIKVNVDKFPNLASENKIMVIPTLKIYKNSKEIKTSTGYLSKDEIKDLLS